MILVYGVFVKPCGIPKRPASAGPIDPVQWARVIGVTYLCDWESGTAKELWSRYRAAAGVAS